MTKTALIKQPLRSIFWFSGSRSKIYNFVWVIFGSLLIAAAAQVQIPMEPVPVTLQEFAVLLVAMSLGWRLGALSVIAYLLEGMVGLPVFAGFSAGPAILLGMNGGYLFAFLIAAVCCGWLAQRGWSRNFILAFATALLGAIIILLIGTTYLAAFIGWHKAFLFGMLPFLLGDILKVVMLAFIIPKFWRRKS